MFLSDAFEVFAEEGIAEDDMGDAMEFLLETDGSAEEEEETEEIEEEEIEEEDSGEVEEE